MLTFWGWFALGWLAVYALGSWVISLVPSPKRSNKAKSVDNGLQGSNRERSQAKFYGWH